MYPESQVTRSEFEALKTELAELKLSRTQRAIRKFKRNKRLSLAIAGGCLLIPLSLYAISITKSFTFTAGNPTVASEVNANFDQLFTKVNDLAAFHPPIGTILAWHKDLAGVPALPASGEWVECNGQALVDGASTLNGQVIPNLNGDPVGANSPGQSAMIAMFLRGGLTSGTGQADAFQGHKHATSDDPLIYGAVAGASAGGGGTTQFAALNTYDTGVPKTDGTNGTPRTASETRPVNMSVVWIMKVK